MPRRCLLGVETEYALGVDTRGPGAKGVHTLMHAARTRLPHLPDAASGMFLANGARFYLDCGSHPEMTTPECGDPWEVVRYVKAGEAILLRLTGGRPAVFRCNVDYSGTRATWGMHESYLHRADPRTLPKRLIPHLVSRVVYSGAGGFDNRSRGIAFTMSPRAVHISRDISPDSTRQRGIFHTKDEPLCGEGWHRLHVLCGESLCSELALWLKVGTTVLVVALSEMGVGPGDSVSLRAPVDAMRLFAADPTCRATAETVSGARMTALDIQRRYLECAEAFLGSDRLPPWAEAVCRGWRGVLDALAVGWETAATSLDWAIKLALYRARAESCGLSWDALAPWTEVAASLVAELTRVKPSERTLTMELVLDPSGPLADEVARLGRTTVAEWGLRWADLERFLALRNELFEIDMRFGQLGEGGIFTTLDVAGALSHHVEGVADVEGATGDPPAAGRARIRGELVRTLAGDPERYICGWDGVWDSRERSRVDLRDPFATAAEWTPCQAGRELPMDELRLVASGLVPGLEGSLGLLRRMERVIARRPRPGRSD